MKVEQNSPRSVNGRCGVVSVRPEPKSINGTSSPRSQVSAKLGTTGRKLVQSHGRTKTMHHKTNQTWTTSVVVVGTIVFGANRAVQESGKGVAQVCILECSDEGETEVTDYDRV